VISRAQVRCRIGGSTAVLIFCFGDFAGSPPSRAKTAIPAKWRQGAAKHCSIQILFQCRKLLLLVAVSFAPPPEFRDHVMTTLINVIRQFARRFVDDGWLPLAILGVVVFWMMHSA
jgi:hypothetical protein